MLAGFGAAGGYVLGWGSGMVAWGWWWGCVVGGRRWMVAVGRGPVLCASPAADVMHPTSALLLLLLQVHAAAGSAVRLVSLVAARLPGFRDHCVWRGRCEAEGW